MEIFNFDINKEIGKYEYFSIYFTIFSILRKNEKEELDVNDIKKTLENDWKNDSHGKKKITKDELFDSLFELVDIWAPDANVDQYNNIFIKICKI